MQQIAESDAVKEAHSDPEDEEMKANEEDLLEEMREQRRQQCLTILSANVGPISKAIHEYWVNHMQEIRHSLSTKNAQRSFQKQKRNISTSAKESLKHLEQVKKFHIAKDLLFIQSEISSHLGENVEINHAFLEMMVSVMSIRNIHNPYMHHDELLLFGAKSIIQLIPKVAKGTLSEDLLDKVFQLFLIMHMKKARTQLSIGLFEVLGEGSKHESIVAPRMLIMTKELNKLKRGVADMELDTDNAILAIKEFIQLDQAQLEKSAFKISDVLALSYNIIYLLSNEEYSIREYAEHAFNFLLEQLKSYDKESQVKLVQLIETQFVGDFLHTVKDEVALKTVLLCLRQLIVFAHDQAIDSRHMVSYLFPLCSPKDETVDFFVNCLSIKLKERQRSLKMLKTKLENRDFANSIKTIQNCILPIVDYLVFGGST